MPPCLFDYLSLILQYKSRFLLFLATARIDEGYRHKCTNRLPLGYCRSQSRSVFFNTFSST
ncbi:hypothetical protein HanXRQr2_Chr17g0824851 [Helianthus annuus]|uniref:Uncharacterized protein n=1 Tax=Helianthus annuus TaxID=4232 RepID=A0A9K3GW62_HELAN|nr:hypothetical protein HanXRQr2_Chr17g0824851 [Helianthus annuus]